MAGPEAARFPGRLSAKMPEFLDLHSIMSIIPSFPRKPAVMCKKTLLTVLKNCPNLGMPSKTPGNIVEFNPIYLLFKFNPMVTVETSQLIAECENWRDALRQHREELTRERKDLEEICSHSLSKTQCQEVEHLHNQLHIQLINVHDLKQAIKSHARTIDYEMNVFNGQLREETLHLHEILFEQFQSLDMTLQELQVEFNRFVSVAA